MSSNYVDNARKVRQYTGKDRMHRTPSLAQLVSSERKPSEPVVNRSNVRYAEYRAPASVSHYGNSNKLAQIKPRSAFTAPLPSSPSIKPQLRTQRSMLHLMSSERNLSESKLEMLRLAAGDDSLRPEFGTSRLRSSKSINHLASRQKFEPGRNVISPPPPSLVAMRQGSQYENQGPFDRNQSSLATAQVPEAHDKMLASRGKHVEASSTANACADYFQADRQFDPSGRCRERPPFETAWQDPSSKIERTGFTPMASKQAGISAPGDTLHRIEDEEVDVRSQNLRPQRAGGEQGLDPAKDMDGNSDSGSDSDLGELITSMSSTSVQPDPLMLTPRRLPQRVEQWSKRHALPLGQEQEAYSSRAKMVQSPAIPANYRDYTQQKQDTELDEMFEMIERYDADETFGDEAEHPRTMPKIPFHVFDKRVTAPGVDEEIAYLYDVIQTRFDTEMRARSNLPPPAMHWAHTFSHYHHISQKLAQEPNVLVVPENLIFDGMAETAARDLLSRMDPSTRSGQSLKRYWDVATTFTVHNMDPLHDDFPGWPDVATKNHNIASTSGGTRAVVTFITKLSARLPDKSDCHVYTTPGVCRGSLPVLATKFREGCLSAFGPHKRFVYPDAKSTEVQFIAVDSIEDEDLVSASTIRSRPVPLTAKFASPHPTSEPSIRELSDAESGLLMELCMRDLDLVQLGPEEGNVVFHTLEQGVPCPFKPTTTTPLRPVELFDDVQTVCALTGAYGCSFAFEVDPNTAEVTCTAYPSWQFFNDHRSILDGIGKETFASVRPALLCNQILREVIEYEGFCIAEVKQAKMTSAGYTHEQISYHSFRILDHREVTARNLDRKIWKKYTPAKVREQQRHAMMMQDRVDEEYWAHQKTSAEKKDAMQLLGILARKTVQTSQTDETYGMDSDEGSEAPDEDDADFGFERYDRSGDFSSDPTRMTPSRKVNRSNASGSTAPARSVGSRVGSSVDKYTPLVVPTRRPQSSLGSAGTGRRR